MAWLNWIDDEDLKREISKLLKVARAAKNDALTKFGNNVIDPFAAIFEISGFDINYELWLESERNRQAQKTLQNHIGEFHQNILGKSKSNFYKDTNEQRNWLDMKVGNVIDLVSDKQKALAEIKNKYNTISGGKLADLYYSLDSLVSPKSSRYYGYTAYYVAIIPKSSIRYNRPFTPSDNRKSKKCPVNDQIREIDGASFYSLVTGYESALEDLFDVIPQVINDCTGSNCNTNNIKELKKYFEQAYK